MEIFVLIVHIVVAVSIVGLVMLQQGKGAEAGASFGSGASQTVFGSIGKGSFLSRLTAVFATIFFLTSLALAVMAQHKSASTQGIGVPEVSNEQVDSEEIVTDAPSSIIDALEDPKLKLESVPKSTKKPDEPLSSQKNTSSDEIKKKE